MKQFEKFLMQSMSRLADFIGKPLVFLSVIILLIGWFAAGFFLDYDVWFDVIDLAIFISTFLLLFVVQSSQNADTRAIQDKLDEIIEALPGTDTSKEKEEKRIKNGDKK